MGLFLPSSLTLEPIALVPNGDNQFARLLVVSSYRYLARTYVDVQYSTLKGCRKFVLADLADLFKNKRVFVLINLYV